MDKEKPRQITGGQCWGSIFVTLFLYFVPFYLGHILGEDVWYKLPTQIVAWGVFLFFLVMTILSLFMWSAGKTREGIENARD